MPANNGGRRALPGAPPPLPDAYSTPTDECLPGCDPYPSKYTRTRNDREEYPPIVIPGTNIIVDPCDPTRGRNEQWYTEQNKVALSTPVPTTAPPQLFDPIAQAQGGKFSWTTVVQHEVPGGMHGLAVRTVTTTNVRAWSDAVEFGLFVSGEIFGEPWIGNKEWPFPIPIARKAQQKSEVSIRARIAPQYWSANWPPTIVSPTPIRNLVTAECLMELYAVGMLKPCPPEGE